MQTFQVRIAEHTARIDVFSEQCASWVADMFKATPQLVDDARLVDIKLSVREGYGGPFVSYDVEIVDDASSITYRRADYELVCSHAYEDVSLSVYDWIGFKHAMMNLYSAFAVSRKWGVMIHSSCVMQGDVAFLFAGHSGNGKSTVAQLSQPRQILSDEASVIRVTEHGVWVYDSPFRTALPHSVGAKPVPLRGIYVLRQSPHIARHRLSGPEAFAQLMERTFYWAHASAETSAIWRLQTTLLRQVPIYELEFQKNELFWEVVS